MTEVIDMEHENKKQGTKLEMPVETVSESDCIIKGVFCTPECKFYKKGTKELCMKEINRILRSRSNGQN